MRSSMLLHMSISYYLLLCFLLPLLAHSCPPYNFSCGNYTLDIQFPFTNNNSLCEGLYHIQCMNLVPVIQFHRQGFYYPIWNISYPEKTIIVHDLKLSSYFRGSECVFLYDFISPIHRFNVSNLSEQLSSGQYFFDCKQSSYNFSHDLFDEFYNLTLCKDYNIYYSDNSDDQSYGPIPGYCSTSSDIWFDWKLSFEENEASDDISLLSAGFSRKWTDFPDCFDCKTAGGNCSSADVGGGSTCNCSNQCLGKKQSGKSNMKIIVGVVGALTGFILACALCFFWYKRKAKKNSSSSKFFVKTSSSKTPSRKGLDSLSFDCNTPLFSYEELQEATNNFNASEELGDGGYGTVYKGILQDGRTVAVKRLYETHYKRVEQFMNEVEILSRLRHPNLVTLYGSTSPQSPHLLLVYEFISNGTLADHLHNPLRSQTLSLPLRLSFAIETAAALSYLHSVDIIHRDIKTHNILVDNDFHVKVADFGLSRLFPPNATHVSTAPQGTPGYLDPEYHRFYQLTDKSDVYSFGVVLMELLSSRPAVDIGRQASEISLAMMAISKIQNGELNQIIDPVLRFEVDEQVNRIVTRIAEIAFRCLQMDREMRPTIKEVLEELRQIEKDLSYKGEEVLEIKVREDSGLLKNSVPFPFSPKSVTHTWSSRSTTPHASV